MKNQYIVNDSDLGSVLIWTNETIIDDEEDDNDDNDGTQTWASGWLFYTWNRIGGRQIPYEVSSVINGC